MADLFRVTQDQGTETGLRLTREPDELTDDRGGDTHTYIRKGEKNKRGTGDNNDLLEGGEATRTGSNSSNLMRTYQNKRTNNRTQHTNHDSNNY